MAAGLGVVCSDERSSSWSRCYWEFCSLAYCQYGGGANCHSLLKAIAIPAFAVILVFLPATNACAETTVFLGDANGDTEMTVGAGDYFDVYLWIDSVTELAGFECHISKTGPATWGTTASVGSWFGTDHTMSHDLGNPALRSQVLEDPTDLTGSGDLAIYHLYATEEGTISVSVTASIFVLGKTDSSKIEVDTPSTLYITVLSGDSSQSGGTEDAPETPLEDPLDYVDEIALSVPGDECSPVNTTVDSGDGGGGVQPESGGSGGALLDSVTWLLTVQSDPDGGITMEGDPESCEGITDTSTKEYTVELTEGLTYTLTAQVSYSGSSYSYGFDHWVISGEDQPTGDRALTFTMTDVLTVKAVYLKCVFVPSDYSDIQLALDAAESDSSIGVIILANGSYSGSGNWDLDFKGTAVLLTSQNGPDVCTINCVDVVTPHRAFKFTNNETVHSVVYGISMINGVAPDDEGWTGCHGGAICCFDASPTIRLCKISNNSAILYGVGQGGGIWSRAGSPVIDRCTLYDNTASMGGGIYCLEGDPEITDNLVGVKILETIHGNSATYSAGGIWFESGSVHGNHIEYNHANDGDGGGLLLTGASTVAYNAINNNTASSSGGGIYVEGGYWSPIADIHYNQLAANTANAGGGVYVYRSARIRGNSFENNIVTGSNSAGGALRIYWYSYGGSSEIDGNTFQGNISSCNGGAVACYKSKVVFSDNGISNGSSFSENMALLQGGGIFFQDMIAPYDITIANALFSHNQALAGGAVAFQELKSLSNIMNCSFIDNTATNTSQENGGGAVSCYGNGLNHETSISNCIFWQNTGRGRAVAAFGTSTVAYLEYSDVMPYNDDEEYYAQEGADVVLGSGIIHVGPNFVHDIEPDPQDRGNENFHLQSTAGRFTDGSWNVDLTSSPCIDAGGSGSANPYARETWPNGSRVNLGAYGNTPEASKTPSTDLVITDATSGSTFVTNERTVAAAIHAPAPIIGRTVDSMLLAESPDWPEAADSGWTGYLESTSYTITGNEGYISVYAWIRDSAGEIGAARSSIYYYASAPVVSNLSITNNGDNTATATWTTNIVAEGKIQYGKICLDGLTPLSAPENGAVTEHSICFDINLTQDKNYKIILVNNEIAQAAFWWPSIWPIRGDCTRDCKVNILDLIYVRNRLGQTPAPNDLADLNLPAPDGKINILDLIAVRNQLGKQCPSTCQ